MQEKQAKKVKKKKKKKVFLSAFKSCSPSESPKPKHGNTQNNHGQTEGKAYQAEFIPADLCSSEYPIETYLVTLSLRTLSHK